MGVTDHADDLGQHGIRGGLRGAHRQCAFAVDRTGIDFVAPFLWDQRTLSGDRRLIDGPCPIDNLTIQWDAVSAAHDETCVDSNRRSRNVRFRAVIMKNSCRRRREVEQS